MMKYSFFKKNGQAERSYRIGVSLLTFLFLISMLIAGIDGLIDGLIGGKALEKGFLFPTQASVGARPAENPGDGIQLPDL